MNKTLISNSLRSLGLLYALDKVRFQLEKRNNKQANRLFRKANPDVKLPPDYLMYESFQMNYDKYYTESIDAANWLVNHFKRHASLENATILDWGCGPGRIIRHLPEILGKNCSYYGTDYNANSIAWCSENLPEIDFNHNGLEARLPYQDDMFDVIYGISIFTHLSEQLHYDWTAELLRILKPGGILFLTTQGNAFKQKLSEEEIGHFNQDKLVIRGKVKEGHRTYSAFHPPAFMTKLFADAKVLEHIERPIETGRSLPQDIWIVTK